MAFLGLFDDPERVFGVPCGVLVHPGGKVPGGVVDERASRPRLPGSDMDDHEVSFALDVTVPEIDELARSGAEVELEHDCCLDLGAGRVFDGFEPVFPGPHVGSVEGSSLGFLARAFDVLEASGLDIVVQPLDEPVGAVDDCRKVPWA